MKWLSCNNIKSFVKRLRFNYSKHRKVLYMLERFFFKFLISFLFLSVVSSILFGGLEEESILYNVPCFERLMKFVMNGDSVNLVLNGDAHSIWGS